ncbi:hypothetical protein C7447_1082 [Tenacibaculum adriaticum]|uniref:Uncharacterized protein n=1 Tax=Tenacibaculum adriaticum TaxID=413713 RepID=A0A5S5DN60_9FLAO|nr:hypothetical protein [Tenacibaculum adriaticum]TYP96252.1 hypothetical protein C7447_1082 [Tenacibaculum adriaticum]
MTSKKIIYFIFLISFNLFFLGCASFSKDLTSDGTDLKSQTEFNKINGKYRIYSKTDSLNKNNIFESLTGIWWKSEKNKLELSNSKESFAKLTIINEKELKLDIFQNNERIKSDTLNGILRNGIFYLNQNLSISGLPYIFGTFTNDKKRIIVKDNSILIDRIKHEFGAVAIIFPAGFRNSSVLEYERIK